MKMVTLFLLALLPFIIEAKTEKPKLIVVISIDQFRADYLQKLNHHFLPAKAGNKVGGFNYLMNKGAYFSHGEYGLLQNMTAPGHATILTGSFAYQNGIPNNDWYDPETQAYQYCTEDSRYKTLGSETKKPNLGTSPKNLIGTTLGDELKNAYPDSKVVAIALKDRSAILMGGHRSDMTFWFEPEAFSWVSSEYYFPNKTLPSWVLALNEEIKNKKKTELIWNKKLKSELNKNEFVPPSNYTKEMGTHFPHKITYGHPMSLLFPVGVEMPVELTKRAITNLKLGMGKSTDLLALSLSSHDYVGHQFGPESDEIREITIKEDVEISNLLNFINEKIPGGLSQTWVVLTADHGVSGNPAYLKDKKIPSGLVDLEAIQKEMEIFLKEKYGKSKNPWLLEPSELNFYVNKKVIAEKELELDKVRDALVTFIKSKPQLLKGIAHVFSGADVRRRTLPAGLFEKQILRTYFEGRSGDIMMIPLPYHVSPYGAATHLSGYSYDRYVPILFSGSAFKSGTFPGGHVVDIAPTLAYLLGIIPPTNSEGDILEKILSK